ncbi:MAG: gamma-glutamylcyclotransferase [Roseiflexus sp.]|nr:gamma-glutamylcyclotransferase [Roseiflexus sp.]
MSQNVALVWDKRSKKDGSAKANIIRRPGSEVWGVVYQLSPNDLRRLDRYESGYERLNVKIFLQDGTLLEVVTYISERRQNDIMPTREYWQRVVRGAEEHHLPPDYIATLARVKCREE